MKKLTQTAILARAISDCEACIADGKHNVEEFTRMGRHTEAVFYNDNILKELEEELETLKLLYKVETGVEY